MNEKNNDKLIKREDTLKKVQDGIKSKMDKSFDDTVEFMGEEFPNIYTVDGEDVLGSQIPQHKEFKKFCATFNGDANTYDNKVCIKSFKNGKGTIKWDWDKIVDIKGLQAFDEVARGKIFFLARAIVLEGALKKEIEELKN